MTFAQFIRKHGGTRADWAKALGVSSGFLSDVLNGNRTPGLRLAVKIELATGGVVKAVSWVPSDVAASAPRVGPEETLERPLGVVAE